MPSLPLTAGPILPGEIRPPAPPLFAGTAPELPSLSSAPLFAVCLWAGPSGWLRCSYAPREKAQALNLAQMMRAAFPALHYAIFPV